MKNKIITEIEEYGLEGPLEPHQSKLNVFKAKLAIKEQRKNLQKRLFGEHYNYSKVGLNKEKKYLLEELKNTEIERSNRILLQKIQRIAKRNRPIEERKRTMTDHSVISDESYNFKPKQFQSASRSLHHLAKEDLAAHTKVVNPRGKVLYQGTIDRKGTPIRIATYVESNRFIIELAINKLIQKIIISIEAYRSFFRQCLDADHSRIVDYLSFNGQLIEFTGIKSQKVKIQQEQQLSLPPISGKPGSTGLAKRRDPNEQRDSETDLNKE